MRRNVTRAIIPALTALLVGACNGNTAPADPSRDLPVPDAGAGATLPDTLHIPLGSVRATDAGRVSVHFVGKLTDSRCPANVVCVWEGDASVRLRISAAGMTLDTVLHTRTEPATLTLGAYMFTVPGLLPYPGTYPDDAPEPSPTVLVAVRRL